MIDPTGRVHQQASGEAIISTSSKSRLLQSQSFGAELSDKLEGTTKGAPQSARLPLTAPAAQKIVTWRDPVATNTSTSVAPPTSTSQPSGLNGLVTTYPSSAPATTSTAGADAESSSQTPASFDDAYWASQPPAVQQLRNIQDPTERTQVAEQLAQQGYSIDVPIMVWGWDAGTTTAARESMGYTWVPSAEQQPVAVAPGLSLAGSSPYDPAHPPAGSITV